MIREIGKISSHELIQFSQQLLIAAGVPEGHASIIACSLVEADLHGVASHGVMRLPIYLKRIQAGSVQAKTSYQIIRESQTMAVLDGQHGMGQVLGFEAMKLCIEKAKKNDVAIVGVKNSHHFGTAAFFSSLALEQDMIGIAMSNTTPLMPAIGGAEAVLGNNPLSIAIPAGDEKPLILDMACSVVAMGKIINAANQGKPIPKDWGVNAEGIPTDDPAQVLQGGFISAMGGPKGFGLALMIDVLCGVLLNGAFGADVKSIYKEVDQPNRCGHLFIAIRIDSFIPVNQFKLLVDGMIKNLKQSEKATGTTEIFMPGEIEQINKQKRLETGIDLPQKVVEELNQWATQLSTPALSL